MRHRWQEPAYPQRIAMKKGEPVGSPIFFTPAYCFRRAMLPFTLLALMSRPPFPYCARRMARAPATRERHRKIAVDAAVHGVEREFCVEARGNIDRDRAV